MHAFTNERSFRPGIHTNIRMHTAYEKKCREPRIAEKPAARAHAGLAGVGFLSPTTSGTPPARATPFPAPFAKLRITLIFQPQKIN